MHKYILPRIADTRIWDVWLGMYTLPVVSVADELQIFSTLNERARTTEELADALGFDRRALLTLLRFLVASGFIESRLGLFQLTDLTRLYLIKESPFYWGPVLNVFNARLFQNMSVDPNYTLLKDKLLGKERKSAESGPLEGWVSGSIDLEQARNITAFMHAQSLASAIGLAQTGKFTDVKKMLDVGGASGVFMIALAQIYPELHCTVMDLANVVAVAKDFIKAGGVENRVDTLALDMFKDTWPKGYDAMFFSNIFHDWNFQDSAFLAKKCYDSLPKGGRIYIHEMLLDDDGFGPLATTAFSIKMLLHTQGQQFTFREFKELLEGIGFANVTSTQSYGYYSLVTATKR